MRLDCTVVWRRDEEARNNAKSGGNETMHSGSEQRGSKQACFCMPLFFVGRRALDFVLFFFDAVAPHEIVVCCTRGAAEIVFQLTVIETNALAPTSSI